MMIPNDYGDLVPIPGSSLPINQRLDEGDARMTRIESGLAETTAAVERIEDDLMANTKATQETATSTSELVGILNAWKGAFKVLDYVGKLAKPLGYIATLGAALVGMWAAFKTGGPR